MTANSNAPAHTSTTAPQKSRLRTVLFLVVTNVLAVGCLIWAMHDIDLRKLGQDLTTMHWGWIAAAAISDIGVYFIHGARWKTLLQPIENIAYLKYIRAIYVGLFANEVLPLRSGEIIRCLLISRWSRLAFPVAFSSFLVERVMDGFGCCAVWSRRSSW